MSKPTEFALRRERLLPTLEDVRANAFLVTALPNVRYLSGYTGSNGMLAVTRDRAVLFTDPRYALQAAEESDCDVKVVTGRLAHEAAKWMTRARLRTVAVEANRIDFATYRTIQESRNLRMKLSEGAIEKVRMVKSAAEIAAIKTSVDVNSAALDQALRRFRSTMTEVDLAAEIEYRMRRLGADGTAFETIVASGPRSAFPHARPTGDRIRFHQLVLVDMGASIAGYSSDMTRTYAVGRPNAKMRRTYRAVLESQLRAIDTIRPGVTADSVDRAARDTLRQFGLEKAFIHSVGHGLGLEIHEPPRLGRKEKTKLESGMVITVEPGAYLEGWGGIRIEDTVLVTARGCEVLTPTSKELAVI